MADLTARSTEALMAKKAELVRKNKIGEKKTPSQLPFPVFAMCPPTYVDTAIKNNVWMNGDKIDKEKFMAQFFNLYTVLAANSMVLLIPPVKGLQDQVYVNSLVFLPHITKNDVIVLSNFTAKGRAGEEIVAGAMLNEWGYQTFSSPHRFESEPELKYLRDDIYFGGHGIRTDINALKWVRDSFEANVIPLREKDERLYHLDCSLFCLGKEDVMVCTDLFDPEEIKRIGKVANIVDVSKNGAYMGACNSLKVSDVIYNNSNMAYLKKTDDEYMKERKKNDELEKICHKLGLEVLYFNMDEVEKSGAYLSCMVANLSGAHARL